MESWVDKVHRGDSLYNLGKLPDASIGAIISDPPFFCGITRDEGGVGSDPWTEDTDDTIGATAWCAPFAKEFIRVVRKGGTVALMGGAHACAAWMTTMEAVGFKWLAEITVLWNSGKPRQANFGSLTTHVLWFAAPGARHAWNTKRKAVYSNVVVCRKIPVQDRCHPAQKPLELTNFLVSLLTVYDDIILDPFCGSGSTLVSAAIVGRPYIGFDKDAAHIKTSRRRLAHWELEEEHSIHLWVNGRLEEI